MAILTTVVGSYPTPQWLFGDTSRGTLRDAIMVVLKTQELAGIDVVADGTVTLTYIPDYPSDDVPQWIETVSLDAAQLDSLYAELKDAGLFTTDWQTEDGPPVGGRREPAATR